jgi:hypothetical protein
MSKVMRTITDDRHIGCVAQDDPQLRRARQPHGADIVGIAHDQRFGPRQARIGRPGGERDRKGGVDDARPERRDEGQRQKQLRNREEHIGDAHEDTVGPAAVGARDSPDQQAQRCGGDDDQRHDQQRQPRSVEDARIDVAAELVRAQPELPPRRAEPCRQVGCIGRMCRQKRRKDRAQDQRDGDRKAQDAQPVAQEPAPEPSQLGQLGRTHLAAAVACIDSVGHRGPLLRPWVERAVKHIRQKVQKDEDRANQDRAAQHRVHVGRKQR